MALRPGFRKVARSLHAHAPAIVAGAAGVVADAIRREAPKRSGRLADSVEVLPGRDGVGSSSALARVSGGHEPEEIVGHVEFGRPGQAANPFIRRASRSSKGRALAAIAAGVRRCLKP